MYLEPKTNGFSEHSVTEITIPAPNFVDPSSAAWYARPALSAFELAMHTVAWVVVVCTYRRKDVGMRAERAWPALLPQLLLILF